jgi:hypothetical protein
MNKSLLGIAAAISISLTSANGAVYIVSNLITGGGSSDTLFQSSGAVNAPLMNGGVVTLGYFSSNAYVPSSDTAVIATTIADFTIVASALTGSFSNQLGEAGTAGYVDAAPVDTASILTGDPLIGRTLYAFVGNAATLAASTAFALKAVGTIADDSASENSYLASPSGGVTPVIGTINVNAFTGNPFPNAGAGITTFDTLQLVDAVPEPSVLLLSAFGVLALLRRKR